MMERYSEDGAECELTQEPAADETPAEFVLFFCYLMTRRTTPVALFRCRCFVTESGVSEVHGYSPAAKSE
jgi:hypothetical protein